MIGSVVKRLFSPLSYFRIRHSKDEGYSLGGSSKLWYDFYIPLALTVLIVFSLYKLNLPFSIFSESGIVSSFSQMLSFLSGFYITALAAIASFNRKDLDLPTLGTPLKIYRKATNISTGQPYGDLVLTRRDYLCRLFGYLAFMSICLFLVGVFGKLFLPLAEMLGSTYQCVRFIFIFVYFYFLTHLIVTTFIGIFYLSERIHQE